MLCLRLPLNFCVLSPETVHIMCAIPETVMLLGCVHHRTPSKLFCVLSEQRFLEGMHGEGQMLTQLFAVAEGLSHIII